MLATTTGTNVAAGKDARPVTLPLVLWATFISHLFSHEFYFSLNAKCQLDRAGLA